MGRTTHSQIKSIDLAREQGCLDFLQKFLCSVSSEYLLTMKLAKLVTFSEQFSCNDKNCLLKTFQSFLSRFFDFSYCGNTLTALCKFVRLSTARLVAVSY